MLITIAELPAYRSSYAEKHLSEEERIPLYLLTVFTKNEQDNLTAEERNSLASLVNRLVVTALEKKL